MKQKHCFAVGFDDSDNSLIIWLVSPDSIGISGSGNSIESRKGSN